MDTTTQPTPVTPPTPESQQPDFWRFTAELIKTVLIVVVLAYVIRLFILQPFIVDGSSMSPRFHTNDYLLVDKLSYHFENPKRGDIVVFKYPNDTSVNYVKRIIGLPGETVTIENGKVTITNSDHPQGFTLDESYLPANLQTLLPTGASKAVYQVPAGNFFVLGDNRPASSDSREWGDLPNYDMIGRVVVQAYPLNKASIISHVTYAD